MKRLLRWVGLAALLVVLCLAAIVFASFRGLSGIEDGRKLEGVEVVRDGIVACYLVDLGPGEVALVDACNDASARAIRAALARRGLGAGAVKAVFLTHGDADHIRGARAFPGAQVLALEPDVALAEGREIRMLTWLLSPKDTGVRVTRALADGEAVELSGVTFRAYAVPGHTKGSVVFLARGVLFMGDSAEVTSKATLAPAKRLTSADPARNRDSLSKLAARLAPAAAEVRFIAPAHSGVLAKGYAPLADFARAFQPVRR
ncbi:MBL fold metallo-hydrolase [Anaeromyxobacter diazotrophicus]|uniref:Glyoxalase n=1 Tax=Anaeromyxobacter diazotrophicus TaxID=2590199 RepID=A0A7I9VH41_9BACT|nr:MBL fold metallo-hydrolase [Anaeromyxobacter diazotrophicus]GEJ55713.1 glyoxalase [Anaeromyxobacter diazotrophicus]